MGLSSHWERCGFLTAVGTTEPHSDSVCAQRGTAGARGRAAPGEGGIPHWDINYYDLSVLFCFFGWSTSRKKQEMMHCFLQSTQHLNLSTLGEVLSAMPPAWQRWEANTATILCQSGSLSKRKRICFQYFSPPWCTFIYFLTLVTIEEYWPHGKWEN